MKLLLAFLISSAFAQSPATIPNNTVTIGKTGASNKTIEFNLTKAGASANPKIRWTNASSAVQLSNDGTNFYSLITTNNNLSSMAATTSAQLAGILSDETGSGAACFATGPTITLASASTAVTQSAGDNTTKIATTAYADALISDTAYNATTWNGVTGIAASKNAVRDQIETLQPLDSDLTTIAGLTATTDYFIQSKSSAWTTRSPTQVTADLIAMVGDSGSGGTKGLVPAPSAGDAAASKFLKADGTWTAVTATGGGSINFIDNDDLETDTTGYAGYADAAGTSPVNGTAGSPTFALSRTTSSPLVGTGSLLLTKDAANRQGEGVSYDFTIATADQAKVLQISMEYIVGSGTFAAGTSTTDSDVTIWIYDVTNSTLIQPSTYRLYSNSSTTSSQYIANFQSASNSTSYRLIWHVGSTSASAYTLKFDRISVGPTSYVYGTPITDWASCPITVSAGFGTVSAANMKAFCRRVGDSKEAQGTFLVGTAAASTASIILDTGTIDTAKIGTVASVNVVGHWWDHQTGASRLYGSQDKGGPIFYDGSDTNDLFIATASASNAITKINGNAAVTTADYVSFKFTIPMAGWSSSVQMSDSADTRVVAASYHMGSDQTATAATVLDFNTKDIDTHAAVTTGASWKFTAPVSGIYIVSCALPHETNSITDLNLYKNGTTYSFIGFGTTSASSPGNGRSVGGSMMIQLNAGDYIDLRPGNTSGTFNGTAALGTSASWISVYRLSGPSAIAATETIAASYYASAGFAATTSTPINFDTKEFDTHTMCVPSASVFKCTAPAAGTYNVSVYASTGTSGSLLIYKNGTAYKSLFYMLSSSNGVNGSALIKLNAGDYIDIRPSGSMTVTGGTLSSVNTSHLNVVRVGN